ncbi:MAG TPA: hypothetical protein VFR37_07430 [Longimicrobium sp.]|nr:hypothetical protein [Longimicrobium sp.]
MIDPPIPDRDPGEPVQEPWDYDRFLETYNRIAIERGGWRYEADGRTPEELGQRYLYYPEYYPTIEVFAEGLFGWDQRLDL